MGVDGEETTEAGEELMRCLALFFGRLAPLLFPSLSSYSRIASSADMSPWLTHSLSLSGYPFHLTRYCRVFFLP